MRKILLPACILLILAAFKSADVNMKTISGLVTDARTGRGIPDVAIYSGPAQKLAGSTGSDGKFKLRIPDSVMNLMFTATGFEDVELKLKSGQKTVDVRMKPGSRHLGEVVIRGYQQKKGTVPGTAPMVLTGKETRDVPVANVEQLLQGSVAGLDLRHANPGDWPTRNESYASEAENGLRTALDHPLSTFSADVDAAGYSNVRRFLNSGTLPPADAVRIEEMINYFDYDYDQPKGKDPIQIHTEIASAPWNARHQLVKIGLQGRNISTDDLPASNLVFLIDVSGSMNAYNKLPLLVSSFKMLTDQLRAEDHVAIVVYAGNAGLVLPSTPGTEKLKIKNALDGLSAGGSTAGGRGIQLAYQVAEEQFIKGGNNRVILATDGDFNVGASSDHDMMKLIEAKRNTGVFLTTLGFGMGNLKDSKMELLADKGNGNYAYIDNISEARKVLISEFGGTLFTIVKDVKLQIEFNPAKVQRYRLIGYENRKLKAKDFNDDHKDAGDMGAGHRVTALYEVIPVGLKSPFSESVDELKYQKETKTVVKSSSKELLTVKIRYKMPEGNQSRLMAHPVLDGHKPFGAASADFRFSASVAEFGMLIKQSQYKQDSNFDEVIRNAQESIGKDSEGYRSEFIKLVKSAKLMAKDLLSYEQTKKPDEKN